MEKLDSIYKIIDSIGKIFYIFYKVEFVDFNGRLNMVVVVLFMFATTVVSFRLPKEDLARTFKYGMKSTIKFFLICWAVLFLAWAGVKLF